MRRSRKRRWPCWASRSISDSMCTRGRVTSAPAGETAVRPRASARHGLVGHGRRGRSGQDSPPIGSVGGIAPEHVSINSEGVHCPGCSICRGAWATRRAARCTLMSSAYGAGTSRLGPAPPESPYAGGAWATRGVRSARQMRADVARYDAGAPDWVPGRRHRSCDGGLKGCASPHRGNDGRHSGGRASNCKARRGGDPASFRPEDHSR